MPDVVVLAVLTALAALTGALLVLGDRLQRGRR
jgi:hypothetical protein